MNKKLLATLTAISFAMMMFANVSFAEPDQKAPELAALAETPELVAPTETPELAAPADDHSELVASPEEATAAVHPAAPAKNEVHKKNQEAFKDKLLLYIPNRVVDCLDIIDIGFGFGPAVKAKMWATRWFAFGGGIGGTAKVVKGYNRQLGAGLQSGWNASFMMITAENTEMYETTRGLQTYSEYRTGVPSLSDSVYNFWRGPRDIFSFGVEGAIFGEVDAEVHPFELVDFAAGLFFLDPKGDDFTMDDIQSS
jgi:hypothetical protein